MVLRDYNLRGVDMLNQFKTGNPVWVYYIDIDSGANLIVPQLLRGRMGEEYQVDKKKFHNYSFIKADGAMHGTFDMGQHNVKLFYRNDDWTSVEEVDTYLQINKTATVRDRVNGMPVGNPVPAGITLKAFEKVTTKDGAEWYEIGSGQWIKFASMKIVSDPFNPKHEKIESRLAKQLTILPLNNVKGVVDYLPGEAIKTYDAPYGNVVAKIPNGQEVKIINRLNDNGEVTWYQLDNKQYVTGNYIKINDN